MKIQTLIVLVVATGAVGGAAFYFAKENRATEKSEVATERLFPDLSAKVNNTVLLTVKKADKEYSFKQAADGWESPDKGGYPVKVEKVKEILVGLSQLRKVEAKTSKPENYSKIGVEDPGTAKPEKPESPDAPAPTSNATLLTLKDDKGGTIASAIVGNTKWEASKPGVYIRKAGEAQSWLADGKLELPSDFTGWVDPQVVNIPRDRVKEAKVMHPEGEVTRVSREKKEDQTFNVADVPAGEELMGANAGDAIAAALAYVSFEDVKPADQIDFAGTKGTDAGKPGPSAEFQMFDGMKVLVQTWEQNAPPSKDGKATDTKMWAHFVATYDEPAAPAPKIPEAAPETKPEAKAGDRKPEEVQKEVMEFNGKTAKWAFQIPPYKASGFKTTVKSMLKNKPVPPPASLNEGNALAPGNSPPPVPNPIPVPPPAATPTPAPTGNSPATGPAPAPTGSPAAPPAPGPGSPVKPPQDPPAPMPGPTGATGPTGSTGPTGG